MTIRKQQQHIKITERTKKQKAQKIKSQTNKK